MWYADFTFGKKRPLLLDRGSVSADILRYQIQERKLDQCIPYSIASIKLLFVFFKSNPMFVTSSLSTISAHGKYSMVKVRERSCYGK